MTESEPFQPLAQALADRSASVVVMGLGAVGLPLVALLLEAGFTVHGVDCDPATIESLRSGRVPLSHLAGPASEGLFGARRVTWHQVHPGQPLAKALPETPAVGVICVPTPLDAAGAPDLEPVRQAARTLARSLPRPALVVLESTSYPGTTREVLAPLFAASGWDEEHVAFAFAPERVDPGHGDPAARHAPRLVGGLDEVGGALARRFYTSLGFDVRMVERAEIAEAAKLVENVYRAVNIALVNELKVSFAAQGIDIWQVLDAAASKGFGFQRFDPGPGAGGSCIPVDPRYLEYFARRGGAPLRLVELAGEIDRSMTDHVLQTLERGLTAQGSRLSGARILLLGVAYKADVDILTESASLRIARELLRRGAQVAYSDPLVPGPLEWGAPEPARSLPLDAETLAAFDACIFLTGHSAWDLDLIARHAPLLVDTRGMATLRQAGDRYLPA
ncbi:MAG: nucleotide sugar dehydrogenase [Planctomycetota bacterium]